MSPCRPSMSRSVLLGCGTWSTWWARSINRSSSATTRSAFRRYYSCSPGEYLRRKRLHVARGKLADATVSLAQIASDAGFADQSHFTRAFKRFTGVTPGRYRTLLAFKTR